MHGKRILLIVGGGIAAYKACELVRAIRKAGGSVRCVLTDGGAHFVTPMTLAALSEQPVHTSLWDLKGEAEMGHIQLSREADLVIVCPATADLLSAMAGGRADSLATTLLLATDKPVLACPAMNVRMWLHPATRRNVERLRGDGVTVLDPDEGEMACGEYGPGRLPEVERIADAIEAALGRSRRLADKHVIVTAGPTHEPIDPVRVIANRSSGKQGFAIAGALAGLGARVTLVAGPVALDTPPGVDRVDVETADQMLKAVTDALPADVAVMTAAVADWKVAAAAKKLKKSAEPPVLAFSPNPDILAMLSADQRRPGLVIGFAAETGDAEAEARAKLARKGCDWIVANNVAADPMGGDLNQVTIVSAAGTERWERLPKAEIGRRLAARIAEALEGNDDA